MRPNSLVLPVALELLSAALLVGQTPVPVRQLRLGGTVAAETFKSLGGVRPLSDGRVLVNDGGGRRLLILDSSLQRSTAVLDTAGAAARAYPTSRGSILPYTADSSLFVDPVALSILVLDPRGRIVRQMATPPMSGISGAFALFGLDATRGGVFDGHGHLLFQGLSLIKRTAAQMGHVGSLQDADSMPIFRFNLTSRVLDTVATLMRINTARIDSVPDPDGRIRVTLFRQPLTAMDGWAMRSDGSIGVVRALEYRVDWILPDGTRHSSPKIAHDWVHITDSAKTAIIDSARAADSAMTAMFAARRDSSMRKRGGEEGAPSSGPRTIVLGGGGTFAIEPNTPFSIVWATPDDLPDYVRPLTETIASVKGDADGNLWITSFQQNPIPGGAVYDIVNRDGTLVDRIQIPGGTFIEGFGPGVVYLGSREGTGYKLARLAIH